MGAVRDEIEEIPIPVLLPADSASTESIGEHAQRSVVGEQVKPLEVDLGQLKGRAMGRTKRRGRWTAYPYSTVR
ncbi:hypothetical protein GCM10027563_25730 [Parasphingorhabdus pacifica]